MGLVKAVLLSMGLIFMMWLIWRGIKSNPEALTKNAFSQSFTTMGVLALILIAAIVFVVKLL